MFFIGTNPHNVQHGTIVGRHHVKARNGWRESGEVGYKPGGMDMGHSYPPESIRYLEPFHDPEEWWVRLQRPEDGRKGWVQVDHATYLLPKGSRIDLRNPKPPSAGPTPSAGRLTCTIGNLATAGDISVEERELWRWLSAEIKRALESRLGEKTLRITGAHNRRQCPDPSYLWGTIIINVGVQGDPNSRSVALFDTPHKSPGLIRVRHGKLTFSELKMRGIPRTIDLIIGDLGL